MIYEVENMVDATEKMEIQEDWIDKAINEIIGRQEITY